MEIFGIEFPALDSLSSILTVLIVVIVLFILFRIFKVIITIVLVVVFLIAAYITNPDESAHIQAVKEKAETSSIRIKESNIKVEDFKVLSLTKAGKEEKLVGIGAFTQVWIFDNLKNLDF